MTTVSLPDAAGVGFFGDPPAGVELIVWDGRSEAPARCREAEFVVSPYQHTRFDVDTFIRAFPSVRVVQLLSAGFDNWRGKVPAGVQLCNGRGVHTGSTAELAVGLALAAIRELPEFFAAQQAERWQLRTTQELQGKRALIIGDGDIGQAVNRRLEAFEVITTRVASTARAGVHGIDEIEALLPQAELVILTVPLTESTTGLVDAAFLAAMPDASLLVNVARGAVVDTDALVAELRTGRISAALDVIDPEPLPPGHPLWSLPNVLITPHVGGGTAHWAERGYALIREQVRRFQAGEQLLNVI